MIEYHYEKYELNALPNCIHVLVQWNHSYKYLHRLGI